MREIKARKSKKYGQQTMIVDDEDYDRVNKFRWTISKTVSGLYAYTDIVDELQTFGRRSKTLGGFVLDAKRQQQVQHRNGNKLDARRENVYIRPVRERCKNPTPTTHGVPGEALIYKYLQPACGYNKACIVYNVTYSKTEYERKTVKKFTSLERAKEFRDSVVKEYYQDREIR